MGQTTTGELARLQASSGAERMDDEYIIPYLRREPFARMLDVGCGIGRTVPKLLGLGYEAYGVDLPGPSGFWSRQQRGKNSFICCDACALPFPDGYFDVLTSLGVIEHIGTIVGDCTLAPGYRQAHRRYARDLLRVTRPGGRILIARPNKNFPLDPQHAVSDQASRGGAMMRMREQIFSKTGINIHCPFGAYHLLSYREIEKLFQEAGAASVRPLSIKGYFALSMFDSGLLRPLALPARLYIEHLPRRLWRSFLNPYVMLEVKK